MHLLTAQKCIVVHSGARDNYQLAEGLYEAGLLDKLFTDVYYPDFLEHVFPGKISSRHSKHLPSAKVESSYAAAFYSLIMSATSTSGLNRIKDSQLSENAFRHAVKTGNNLFCYSYYAFQAFAKAIASGFPGKKLLFQLHPHPLTVRELMEGELTRVPRARASVLYENEFSYTPEYLKLLCKEPEMADHIAVASSFTKQTLLDHGVPEHKIRVIPYGIDAVNYPSRTKPPAGKSLRIIFVGSLVQRKGISDLLEAVHTLQNNKIELVFCGRGFVDRQLLASFSHLDFIVKENLSREQLVHELHMSDVFVLPSIAEGFAHVIIEAMSAGLPVITTVNTCGPDIIENGKEGFVLPVKNAAVLTEKLQWCLDNKSQLYEMGQQAAIKAKLYTWDKFKHEVVNFYLDAIK